MAQQTPGDQPYGIVVNAQIRYADPPEPSMVELDKLDYKPKPIDPEFKNKPDEYPKTGTHHQHDVFAEGIERLDANGNPYPTKLGIQWLLNPGQAGTGKDYKIEPGTPEWDLYRTDKSDPVREADCIFCLACETVCPTQAIKIFQP
jgi:NAD-dependent dihydropyrimidine dehydrogenase PreA subunit